MYNNNGNNNGNKNGNGKSSIWVESLWVTRKESISVKIGDDTVTREISVGMTVKSEDRATSPVLHEALNKSLSFLIEKEKELWLDAELMRREGQDLHDELTKADALMNGHYQVVDKPVPVKSQNDGNGGKQASSSAQPKPRVITKPIKNNVIF